MSYLITLSILETIYQTRHPSHVQAYDLSRLSTLTLKDMYLVYKLTKLTNEIIYIINYQ